MTNVIIDGVRYIPTDLPTEVIREPELTEETQRFGFQVGDFVAIVENPYPLPLPSEPSPGAVGKVVKISSVGGVGVEFIRPFKWGHTLAGASADRHGYWFFIHRRRSPIDTICFDSVLTLELIDRPAERPADRS